MLAVIALIQLCVLSGAKQFVLGIGDLPQHSGFLEHLRIDLQFLKDLFHHRLAVIGIINGKGIVIADLVDMPPQQTHTGGMEGHDPYAFGAFSHDLVHTFAHLPGRLIGKGDGHDIVRLHADLADQVCHTVRQHSGLAGARTRYDQKRAVYMARRFVLSVI